MKLHNLHQGSFHVRLNQSLTAFQHGNIVVHNAIGFGMLLPRLEDALLGSEDIYSLWLLPKFFIKNKQYISIFGSILEFSKPAILA